MSKIAFVLPSMAHGGAQKVFLEVATELSRQGFDISLLCLDKQGELLDAISDDLDVHYLSTKQQIFSSFNRLKQWFYFRRWVRKHEITTLYSTVTGMNLFVLTCFGLNKKVKVIVREASSLENISFRPYRFALRLLLPLADKVLCTSEYLKEQLISLGVNEQKLCVRVNPIDLSKVVELAKLPVEFTKISASLTLVAVGRLVRAKGFDILIKSMALLQDRLSVNLILVGAGPEQDELEKLTSSLCLTGRVKFVGYQSNPYPYMALSDVFVLSSRWEGYVNTVIEAMVLGLPIVATDCKSGPTDMLKNELGASLVSINSPEAMAQAIEDTSQQSAKLDYSRLLERHALASASKAYLDLYK